MEWYMKLAYGLWGFCLAIACLALSGASERKLTKYTLIAGAIVLMICVPIILIRT